MTTLFSFKIIISNYAKFPFFLNVLRVFTSFQFTPFCIYTKTISLMNKLSLYFFDLQEILSK